MHYPRSFPEDLVHDILSYIASEDPRSLKQCALVGRSWAHPSQSHLFRHRNIDMWFGGLLRHSQSYRLYAMLQLYPRLTQYVRSITVKFTNPDGGFASLHSAVLQEVLLATTLPHLSNLVAICLWRFAPGTMMTQVLFDAVRATLSSQHVQHVSLMGQWHFASFAQFTRLMGTPIPSLTSLELDRIRVPGVVPVTALSRTAGPPVVIQSLRIRSTEPDALSFVASWFSLSTHPVEVKKLVLFNEDVTSFVNVFASCLEVLDLRAEPTKGVHHLGSLSKLTKLALWWGPRVLALLETIPPNNCLGHLNLKASPYRVSRQSTSLAGYPSYTQFETPAGPDFTWVNELDEYLASERFPHLRAVILSGFSFIQSSTQPIKQLMPVLVGRRTLHVLQGPGDMLMSDELERLVIGLGSGVDYSSGDYVHLYGFEWPWSWAIPEHYLLSSIRAFME